MYRKIKGFFLAPSKTFDTIEQDSLLETIGFFVCIVILYFVMSAILFGLIVFLILSGSSSELVGTILAILSFGGLFLVWGGVYYGVYVLAVMSFTILWIIVSVPITHIGVYILGGRKGFIQTLKVVICASTILLLLGWWMPPTLFIGWIWASVVEIIGIRQLQDLSTTRAIVASIMPRIIMLCIIFLFWAGYKIV